MKIKVMVADKDESIAFLYAEEIEDDGHKVILIHKQEGLLTAIEEHKPQALILGLYHRSHSEIDLKFLGRIKKAYPDLPIIFNTSLAHFENEALARGADYFNVKSHDIASLKKIINEIAEKSGKE